jgi:thioredoxin-related protein
MKVLFSLLLSFGILSGVFAQEQALPASKIMDDAYAQAAKENKLVFLMFHASWCGWCHRMDSLMNTPATKPLFSKYFVVTHLVTGENGPKKVLDNPGANELMIKYNGDKQGIPYWVFLTPKGKLLSDSRMPAKDKKTGKKIMANTGCPAQADEVAYFVKLLKKTTSLNETELALIAKVFTK